MQLSRLVFDSLNSPEGAGLPGSPGSDRQLVYQYESTTVNVLIRVLENSDQIALLGQVLDVSMRAVHDLPVLLLDHNKILAQTTTSQFGEFGLQSDCAGPASLQIRLSEGSWIYMLFENMS
jgi:hypothetical protein